MSPTGHVRNRIYGCFKEQIKWVFQLSPLRGVIILYFMDTGMLKLFTTKIVEV